MPNTKIMYNLNFIIFCYCIKPGIHKQIPER